MDVNVRSDTDISYFRTLSPSTMPPRKVSAASSSEAPRRSTRISAQPKEEEKPAKTAGTSKKRAADEKDADAPEDESSTNKKVKIFRSV